MTVTLDVVESGSGPGVVLLHAFPLDASMWDDTRQLLPSSCRLVTPHLRGFGTSASGEDAPSLDAMADDVAALLDRLGLADPVLGGLSMGGYVTMAFLRRHPGRAARLRGVVLADTKASADSEEARGNRLRIADTVLAERSPGVLSETVLPGLLGPATVAQRPAVVERVTALVAAARPDGVAWAQRAMAARPDSFAALSSLRCPLLVVRGEDDALASGDDARAMVAAGPAWLSELTELTELASVGHLSALEDPEAFAGVLGAFLHRVL